MSQICFVVRIIVIGSLLVRVTQLFICENCNNKCLFGDKRGVTSDSLIRLSTAREVSDRIVSQSETVLLAILIISVIEWNQIMSFQIVCPACDFVATVTNMNRLTGKHFLTFRFVLSDVQPYGRGQAKTIHTAHTTVVVKWLTKVLDP